MEFISALSKRATFFALVAAGLLLGGGDCQAADDPVDLLRQTIQSLQAGQQSEGVIEYYGKIMQERVNGLKTVDEMMRALALDDWRPEKEPFDVNVKKVNESMRKAVGENLKKAIVRIIEKGSPNARLAAANYIAETGPTIAALDIKDHGGYMRSLTPEVVRLARDPDLAVRQEGLRALGNINAVPKEAVPVFKAALEKDPEVGPRRLAADGLAQMIRVSAHLEKKVRSVLNIETTKAELIDIIETAIRTVGVGLLDPDMEVRVLTLGTIQIGAQAIGGTKMIEDAFKPNRDFPPPGQLLTDAHKKDILSKYEQVEKEFKEIKPLIEAFRVHLDSFRKALTDPSPQVQLASLKTLEEIGIVRARIRYRAKSLPTLLDDKGKVEMNSTDLPKVLGALQDFPGRDIPSITPFLRSPELRLRRTASRVMETLEEDSLPAMPELLQALRDPDAFVRLNIIKTIGYFPPKSALPAVQSLGRLLEDEDFSVRNQAAFTLELMGDYAREAMPGIARAVVRGDVECRLNVMNVIQHMSPEIAQESVPALIECLNAYDARVLRGATRTLGMIGPPAASAVSALRRLLGNEDEEVRKNASGAILSILRNE